MNATEPPIAQSKSQRVYWIFQLAGWGLFTLETVIGAIALIQLPWFRTVLEVLLINGLALGLSHALRAYVRRHQWRALSLRKLTWRIVIAGLVLGTPLGIVAQFSDLSALHDPSQLLQEYAPKLAFQLSLPTSLALEILNWAFIFMIWLTIYFTAIAVREHRSAQLRQSELTRALQLAELRLLKSQLNPHFLFNSLNTVRSLIADSPSRAQNAVTRLANTLRYTLASRQDELVTLSQEMDIVADYLELETMRFEDRLRIEKHIPADAAGVRIPVMLLQTLVENAIKHGIAELPSGGILRISAVRQDDTLILEVDNPRPAAPARATHEGVGLRNARDRLRLLFGARASLDLDLSKPALATARLRIPVLA
ncbi:MAG TPA: histidine kinase [Steroidobacteraceae bacterium]|jgi:two-component sensor histidine kinase|nr:histidine kinase [Steroidobacteraceae bacterium]